MNKTKKFCLYFLAFTTPILLLLIMFTILHIFPFGNLTLSRSDMTTQYVAIMTYVKSNLFHPGKLAYSFSIGIGSNFFSVLAYYALSPINLLTFLFPNQYMPLFFEFNILFSLGMISLTFSIFIVHSKLFKVKHELLILLFSSSFALSNYFIEYSISTMWLNTIILFPIIILGFEQLWEKQHCLGIIYYVTLSIGIITNYYIGYMFLMFLIYTGIYILIFHLIKKQFSLNLLKRSIKIVVISLLSVSTAMISLLPSYLSQQKVYQAPFQFDTSKMFSLRELFPAIFIGGKNRYVPFLITSFIVFISVIYFVINPQIKFNVRVWVTGFILLLLITTWIKATYMVWHGLTLPNGFPQRESFILLFVLASIGYYALSNTKINQWALITSTFILILIAIFAALLRHQLTEKQLLVNVTLIMFTSLGIMSLNAQKYFKPAIILGLVVALNCGAIIYSTWNEFATNKIFASISDFTAIYEPTERKINQIKSSDPGFYRIGANYQISMNDPLNFNYNGISGYVSQQPTQLTDYLSYLGFYQKHSWYRWAQFNSGSTKAINSLLGTKYILSAGQNIDNATQRIDSFPTLNQKDFDGKKIKSKQVISAQNRQAFPLAFPLAQNTIKSFIYNPVNNPFEEFNRIFNDINNSTSPMYVPAQQTDSSKQNLFKLKTTKNGNLYLYLPSEQQEVADTISIKINHHKTIKAFGKHINGENGIINLGRFKINTPMEIEINGDQHFANQPLFYNEDQQVLNQITTQIKTSPLKTNVSNNNKIVTNTFKSFHGSKIAFSIPYDSAWQINIDGNPTNFKPSLGDLIAVKVPKGAHTIELKYHVPGLRIATLVTLASLLIYLLLIYFFRKTNYKTNKILFKS